MPEICIKTTIINFTVTMKGLEDKVLKLLKESEGNVLDNESLITTLQQSKMTSTMIMERVAEAEKTNEDINSARENYRVVATRGSLIYFVVADLGLIDPMYQYSLQYFQKLYARCVEASEKNDDLETRLGILVTYITEFMYTMVCRGLFEAHKMIYSFLICTSVLRESGEIPFSEWNFFLRMGKPPSRLVSNPDEGVFEKSAWNLLAALQNNVAGPFEGITEHVRDNLGGWTEWIRAESPHLLPLPEPWCDSLNDFQRTLVIRCLRTEKIVFAVGQYVEAKLGKLFIQSPPYTLSDVFPDTSNISPIIFVLSQGADPLGALFRFAEEQQMRDDLECISLGQGQGPIAEVV